MSSALSSHVLVSHKYATDRNFPSVGEIIVVRLSQELFGPGSEIESSCNLRLVLLNTIIIMPPSCALFLMCPC